MGLMMCCNLYISSLIVGAIVDAFSNAQYVNNDISPILDDCRLLISCIRRIQFNHCYRQVNRCANSLARMSTSQEADFLSFDNPPVDVFNAYEDDCNRVYLNRLCPAPFVAP